MSSYGESRKEWRDAQVQLREHHTCNYTPHPGDGEPGRPDTARDERRGRARGEHLGFRPDHEHPALSFLCLPHQPSSDRRHDGGERHADGGKVRAANP